MYESATSFQEIRIDNLKRYNVINTPETLN